MQNPVPLIWRILISFLPAMFVMLAGYSQLNNSGLPNLARIEDTLKTNADKIVNAINSSDRLAADSIFTRTLVRALKTNNSFYYPFDSLETISRLYAPDSSFRIFTWQMVINENVVRQHGAIQLKTPDGSLKLFPLIDKSDITKSSSDTVGNHLGWMGAVYYRIIGNSSGNKNYYTLLGFDANNIRSSKKIIEVLHFENGQPVFGGDYFTMQPGSKKIARYIMEFKKDAGARLTYDQDMAMIIMEHLVSESNEPQKKWTYIGDGDYEGFRWEKGKWIHVNKVFSDVTPEGKEPVPQPIEGNKFGEPLKTPPKKGVINLPPMFGRLLAFLH